MQTGGAKFGRCETSTRGGLPSMCQTLSGGGMGKFCAVLNGARGLSVLVAVRGRYGCGISERVAVYLAVAVQMYQTY